MLAVHNEFRLPIEVAVQHGCQVLGITPVGAEGVPVPILEGRVVVTIHRVVGPQPKLMHLFCARPFRHHRRDIFPANRLPHARIASGCRFLFDHALSANPCVAGHHGRAHHDTKLIDNSMVQHVSVVQHHGVRAHISRGCHLRRSLHPATAVGMTRPLAHAVDFSLCITIQIHDGIGLPIRQAGLGPLFIQSGTRRQEFLE